MIEKIKLNGIFTLILFIIYEVKLFVDAFFEESALFRKAEVI